jgi:alpha-tubulin suppressor-like RCC1 family protein
MADIDRTLRLVLRAVLAVALLGISALTLSYAAADPNEGSTAGVVDSERLITAGNLHTCAVLDSGGVRCWGSNDHGELGNGTTTTSTVPVVVSNLSGVLQVSAGGSHTCALVHGGTVKCWGLNGNGQLGSGKLGNGLPGPAFVDSIYEPVDVVGLTGAKSVASGGFHSCAIKADGKVACWGQDGSGQLGDEDPGDYSTTPVDVHGITVANPAKALALGDSHSCAILADGTVKCWGHNFFGELGDGTTTERSVATAVTGLAADAAAITAGESHTCVIVADANRTTYCWGHNAYGQLGHKTPISDNGTPADPSDDHMSPSPTPLRVRYDDDPSPLGEDILDLVDGLAVAAGQYHSCELVDGGGVRCWGSNQRGQLGADANPLTKELEDTPYGVLVPGLGGATAVTAGGFHSCALTGSAMRCWGYDFFGQLGGFRNQSTSPVTVTAVAGASQVAAGTKFACALIGTPAGAPVCWGSNANGRLGAGLGVANTTIRVPVSGIGSAVSVDAGNGHACVLPTTTDTPRCWGAGTDGQLGNTADLDSSTPVSVSGLANATHVEAGGAVAAVERGLTCARTTSGRAQCWGRNGNGQLGDNTTDDNNTPVTVQIDTDPGAGVTLADLTNVASVATGGFHACARISDGTVRCWGYNGAGELGDNTNTERHTAVLVQKDTDPDPDANDPLTGVVALAAGDDFTCALLGGGAVRCWGANGSGQLGDGTNTARNEANKATRTNNEGLPTTDLVDADLLAAGDHHACARRTIGSVVCWGENGDGQLGIGSTADSDVGATTYKAPEKAEAIPFVTSLSASRHNSCVRLIDTTVECFGDNSAGQLGDGIGQQSIAPVPVVNSLAVAGNHIPDPQDDTGSTSPGNDVTVNVLANDTDADGDPLTVVSVGPPAPMHGTATDNGDGTVTYSPEAGFCGDDAFPYAVSDGTATVSAIVRIEMNCAPTAANDTATTTEDTAKDIAVLANDTDPDGDALTVVSVTDPVHGAASVNGDGTVKYTPDADFCSPPTDTFSYTISDGHGHSVVGGVEVTVSCGNDAPVANPDVMSTNEDTPADFAVLANDTDVDGDTLTVSGVGAPGHGTTSTNGAVVHYVPAADYGGPDSFTYTVSDGHATSVGTVTVSVGGAADAPRPKNDAKTTAEDTAAVIDVLANDVDPDGDTLSIGTVGAPAHGTAVAEAGRVRYTPGSDYCGTDSFTYVASDGALTGTAVVEVTVTCVNDPPVAVDDTETTPEDTELHAHVLTNDTDADGDTMHVTGASGATHGTLTVSASSVTYVPEDNFCGSDSFTYTVADSSGATANGAVFVTVACVNDPVQIAAAPNQATPWGQLVTVPLTAADNDPGDTLTFSLVSGPSGATASGSGAGTFSWTPSPSQVGTHNVTVRVSDGTTHADATFQVAVTKREASLAYNGATGGQYSDAATASAVLTDTLSGAPVSGRTVTFTLGSSSDSATTTATGQAVRLLAVPGAVGPTTMSASFAGDAAYKPAPTATQAFTVNKESLSVRFAADLTQTSGTSAPVTLTAAVAEEPDGSFGTLSGVNVTFKDLSGATLCSAPVTTTSAGQGTATCSAGTRNVGSTAVVVAFTAAQYAGNADVGVFTVGNTATGNASGAGRVGDDAFGFQARPGAKKAAPTGDVVHVFRTGGAANVVRATTLSSLTVSCTTGKTRVCSTNVQSTTASTTTVDLTTGAVGVPSGVSTIKVDGKDIGEPGTSDTYAVNITGSTPYNLPATVISTGNVRVVG